MFKQSIPPNLYKQEDMPLTHYMRNFFGVIQSNENKVRQIR